MAKVPAYARFLYLTNQALKSSPDPEFEGCADVLAYICVKDAEGIAVKITELVQSLQFGTGPTVHRKVSLLVARGLLDVVPSKGDARSKDLLPTSAAMNFLKERSRLMKQCIEA